MFTTIATLLSLIFIQPPLLLLRLFWSLTLLPLRITLLPSRIFLSIVSNVISVLWIVYGRILQLLYNFPALIPWTLLVSVIASLTGYCLHHLNNFLYNTQYLSPSATTPTSPIPTSNSPRAPKHHKAQQQPSHLKAPPTSTSPTLLIPPTSPTSPSITIPRSPSPSSQTIPKPTSPLLPLLPPDSPLLSRYISPTPQTRPAPDRNISYRSQMRELMTERQEQLIALHEEEKRRRTLSPGSPTFTPKGRDALTSPFPSSTTTSPPLVRQRVERERERPVSWPPLVVVESEVREKGSRTVSGGYGRKARLDRSILEGGGRGREEHNSNILSPSISAFPSVPRTILEEEEEEEEDDSSDLDFY